MKKVLLVTITTYLLLVGCGQVTPTNIALQNGQSPLVTDKTYSATEKSPSKTTAPATLIRGSATTVPSLTPETKSQPYSIITATFSRDNIKIQYPQIKGLGDNSKEKVINDLIKSDLLKSEVEEPINFYGDGSLTMNLSYQVTMNTPELLSIVYTGNSKIKGASFPTRDAYAITIDLKNVIKLKLSDFTVIDTKLAREIKQSTMVTNEPVKNGMDKNDLVAEIQNMDDQTIIRGLKEQWAYYTFYVTPNSLVVSVAVSHASGDYALIELLGQYMRK